MKKEHGIEIVTRREILILAAVGLILGVAGAVTGFLGLFPLRASVAASILLFMLLFFLHLRWRYGPIKAAVAAIEREDFDSAISILDNYLQSKFDRKGRTEHLALVLKAGCLFYREQFEKALEIAQTVLRSTESPGIEFFAQNNIISCYICMRKPLKAHAERSKLLTISIGNPAKREALINIGLVYMNCEFFREAIETWDDALKLFPDDQQRAYILGFQATCYNRIRSYDNALEKCHEAKRLNPKVPLTKAIILDNVAFAYANKKEKLDEALAYCKEAFSLSVPAAEPHLHMTIGEVYYARGELDLALESLKTAVAKVARRDKNSHQKAYLTLGKIYQAKGMDDEAREALNQAISIDPTKTLAVHAQQILRDPAQ